MANEIKNNINPFGALDPSLKQPRPATDAKKGNEEISKNEFLQLLVTQLKNQDPLDPLKNDEFAVNLAQFSQLEQLIKINESLKGGPGTGAGGDFSSMASYLGHLVTLGTSLASVKDGDGGLVRFKLDSPASAARLELLREDGTVAESLELGALEAGKHTAALSELTAKDGDYTMRLVATSAAGSQSTPEVFVAGIVSGFVPGPDPLLLVGDKEVTTADIKEVTMLPPA